MASEKCEEISKERNEVIETTSSSSRLGKAVAHRAVYGPNMSRRQGKSRKVRNQLFVDNKTLPSRLSRVSVADDYDETAE